jgi:hypothetical protein
VLKGLRIGYISGVDMSLLSQKKPEQKDFVGEYFTQEDVTSLLAQAQEGVDILLLNQWPLMIHQESLTCPDLTRDLYFNTSPLLA